MPVLLLGVAPGLGPTPCAADSLEPPPVIQVATFQVSAGTIYVNLPDDLVAGETASGTVNPVPNGKDAREQSKKREELERYSVELAGRRAPVSERVRTFVVPSEGSAMRILLFDRRGKPAGEERAALRTASPAPASFEAPSRGQSGAALSISGPFDGDLSNSSVRIGDQDAGPIAESSRRLVVRGPQQGAAETTVEVKERGAVVTTGTYRNVGVRLAAGAMSLLSGQSTTLSITVSGVEGLRETLPVGLVNHSPGTVSMEGGEQQTLCVKPDDVKQNGTWTATRKLTGVHSGGFSIDAIVSQPRPHAESWVHSDLTPTGELRARLVLERPARTAGGDSLPAGGYGVLVRSAGERGAVQLLLASRGKEAGHLPGAVFQHVRSVTLCDRGDVSEAVQQAQAGTGSPSFRDLGFESDQGFAVRDLQGALRLVLTSAGDDFSIEADLAASLP